MKRIRVSAIAAIAKDSRAIGKDGGLLHRIRKDMRHFQDTTDGSVVIMGRKTWESIPEKFRPLSNRVNIVTTRNPGYEAKGAILAGSLEEALEKAGKAFFDAAENPAKEFDEIFIMGGAEIYKQALEKGLIERLYLTLIDTEKKGDAFFPEYAGEFRKQIGEPEENEEDGVKFSYVTLER